jgi:hypothetical protein
VKREKKGEEKKSVRRWLAHTKTRGENVTFSTGILLSATTLGHWLKYMKELAIGNINVKTEQVSEREWIKR